MSGQGGQDAKFFQRGKIQVRDHTTLDQCGVLKYADSGIPRRAGGGGGQGKEVNEAEDGPEEDCCEYHHGQ